MSKLCPGPPYFKQGLLRYTFTTQGTRKDHRRIKCLIVLALVMRLVSKLQISDQSEYFQREHCKPRDGS